MLDDISPKKFHRKALENAHAALFIAWAEAVLGEEMVDDTTDKSTDKPRTSLVMAPSKQVNRSPCNVTHLTPHT